MRAWMVGIAAALVACGSPEVTVTRGALKCAIDGDCPSSACFIAKCAGGFCITSAVPSCDCSTLPAGACDDKNDCTDDSCSFGACLNTSNACACAGGSKLCAGRCIPNAACCSNGDCPLTSAGSGACADLVCHYSCMPGFADCNGGTGFDTDGCEVDVDNDPLHCGDCATVCPATGDRCLVAVCNNKICGTTSVCDMSPPDMTVLPDLSTLPPDLSTLPDLSTRSDLAMDDLSQPPPDLSAPLPDLSAPLPDLSAPDLLAPDLGRPDLASSDLSSVDLSSLPDLSSTDLALTDLTAPVADLSHPPAQPLSLTGGACQYGGRGGNDNGVLVVAGVAAVILLRRRRSSSRAS